MDSMNRLCSRVYSVIPFVVCWGRDVCDLECTDTFLTGNFLLCKLFLQVCEIKM